MVGNAEGPCHIFDLMALLLLPTPMIAVGHTVSMMNRRIAASAGAGAHDEDGRPLSDAGAMLRRWQATWQGRPTSLDTKDTVLLYANSGASGSGGS